MEILTSSCIVFSIVTIIIELPTINAYKSYQMNKECGKTIAIEENGGELHLDSSKLSRSKLPYGKCRVYIATSGHYQDVMFYFTEFSVGVSDTRTNVTIRGQYRVRFPELPIDLNGNNKSLTNPVRLFEVEDSMSVSYQTTFAGRDASKFTMKFIYLGDCKAKGMSMCENGRCVSTDIKCNKTLYACGTSSNECSKFKGLVLLIVYVFLPILAPLLLCLVLLRSYIWMKRKYPDLWNNCTIRNIRREASHNSDNISIANPENVEVTEIHSLSASEANGDTFSPPNYETVIPNIHENIDNPFTSSLGSMMTQSATPTIRIYAPTMDNNYPTLPPPSYSEVMSNENKYIK